MTDRLVSCVCYVRLAVRDPQAGVRYAADVLGLQPSAEQDGELSLRADGRLSSLTFLPAGSEGSVGIELRDEAALAAAGQALAARGFAVAEADAAACRRRFVQAALLTRDASGNAIDLVLGPLHSGRRYFPSRDAGVTGLHGVGLRSRDIGPDLDFWAALGATISDRVGDIAYLRLDGRHHRVALYPSAQAGLLDAAFEVESLDNLMQSSYFAQERQVKVLHGPGRETVSNLAFLRLQGLGDTMFSFVTGPDDLSARAHRPRRFPLAVPSLCAWGSACLDVPELSVAG